MKYKLNVIRDVDIDSDYSGVHGYILNLPSGFRMYDELCHVRGFDTMQELRDFVKWGVVPCDCQSCLRMTENEKFN